MRIRRCSGVAFTVVMALVFAALPVWADSVPEPPTDTEYGELTFSGAASDNDENVEVFDGLVTYWFLNDEKDDEDSDRYLSVTIENQTAGDFTYSLAELFFNVNPDVDPAITLELSYWSVDQGVEGLSPTLYLNQSADGFGTFDYQLDLTSTNDGLPAGTWGQFVFAVTGSEAFGDFLIPWESTDPPLGNPAPDGGGWVSAMKFTQGPENDSVYTVPVDDVGWGGGGQNPIVPEPATFVLLGMGLALGVAVRKVRRA
jgi:hypothetical protein